MRVEPAPDRVRRCAAESGWSFFNRSFSASMADLASRAPASSRAKSRACGPPGAFRASPRNGSMEPQQRAPALHRLGENHAQPSRPARDWSSSTARASARISWATAPRASPTAISGRRAASEPPPCEASMTALCHNLPAGNGRPGRRRTGKVTEGRQQISDEVGFFQAGSSPCYIHRRRYPDTRAQTGFRGMEQPGSSSGS